MAKKETTSDQLKKVLAQYGGAEKDWKRTSKKKNATGQWVREFENSQIGVKLEATETAEGAFTVVQQAFSKAAAPVKVDERKKRMAAEAIRSILALDDITEAKRKEAIEMLTKQFGLGEEGYKDVLKEVEEEKKQQLSTPPVETDAAKNKAADEIIERILECEEVPEAKLKKAGKALANRFGFGIGTNDDGYSDDENAFYLAIAPLEDTCYDQHVESYIEHLLPEGMSEECEASFSYTGKMTLMELAEDLMRRGFVLDRGMQEQMDGQQKKPLWPELKELFDKVRSITPPTNKPGNDAPKP
ncbi:MAG: hypothetical protein K8R48_00595 [Alphaproteobacteria bacterium]|nr:hypothetical protein [Alphaproteobacteria bacterium]